MGDVVVLALVGIGIALLQLASPHRRLFSVGDPTLSFPLLTETVPIGLLTFLALGVPLIALVLFRLIAPHRPDPDVCRTPHARSHAFAAPSL